MPTLRGIVFAIFHAGLLTIGVLRDELGIVVWAGGVLLLVVAVELFALAARARLLSKRDDFTSELETVLADAGEEVGVRASVPRVGMLPGFLLRHTVALQGTGARVLNGSAGVRPGTQARWALKPALRGDYRADGSTLELADLFGFSRSRIHDDAALRLQVLATVAMERPPLPARRGGDRAADRSSVRVRSDELRELRPYVPGDDVRRLSWKHLAAHDELLIRVGEFVPPSRGEVRCRVDPWVPTGASSVVTGDLLMEALRALIDEAAARGVRVQCAVPGWGTVLSAEADPATAPRDENTRRMAAVLAGYVPHGAAREGTAGGTGEPGVPGDPVEPGVPSADHRALLITARSGGAGQQVLSVAPLLEPDSEPTPLWRRLLVREAS